MLELTCLVGIVMRFKLREDTQGLENEVVTSRTLPVFASRERSIS